LTSAYNAAVDLSISAANVFTDALKFSDGAFVIAVTGTFVGTVTLQVRPDIRDVVHDWVDEQSYTAPDTQLSRVLRGDWEVRAGIKAGNYTSGTAHVSLAA